MPGFRPGDGGKYVAHLARTERVPIGNLSPAPPATGHHPVTRGGATVGGDGAQPSPARLHHLLEQAFADSVRDDSKVEGDRL